jgi:Ca-activated chloride channel homolog
MTEYGMMDSESGEMLALRGVEVSAGIAGLLASTTLVQKYKNDTDTNLELSYTFPIPVAGTLLSFAIAIGERKYDGEVIPRMEAEAKYEETIGEGNTAFRLQEVRTGMYNATLGNVMPSEEVAITLTYAEPLSWNGKSIRYRLPTTIAPRYGEPTGMQPWQRPETSLVAEYPLNVTVSIAGDLAESAVSCPSHKVSMKMQSNALTIQLAKGASMDRDFILEIENDQVRSLGTIAHAMDTNVAMLTLLPPELECQCNQRDVVLVIDCSGSMQGDSIALAREGVLLALGSLGTNERFGLIAFGTSFLQFDRTLQPANRKNLDMARRWVSNLDNLGGTDINGALELALKLKGKAAMDILLLTDGQDWQVGESVAKAKSSGVRIFSMGIGSAVAEDAVQMMADETGGACELVAPTEDMSERIYRHFNRMRQPQMEKLEVTWPTAPLWECRPSRSCFAGDAYTVFAALPDALIKEVSVRFEFSQQEPHSLTVPLRSEEACADAIVRLGAKQRLATLDEDQRQSWAVAYQLITADTDYLITVERSSDEKATDLPALQTQPQMLPAGWGGSSSVVTKANLNSVRQRRSHLRGPLSNQIFYSIEAPSRSYDQIAEFPSVVRSRNMVEDIVAGLSNTGYNRFIEKLNQMSGRRLYSKIPTTLEQLLKLPVPETLAKLLAKLATEGVAKEELIQSFYVALMGHSGKSSLSQKLLAKVTAFLKNELADDEVVERIRETLDLLWDAKSSGADRYDIPAFLRRSD